MQGRGGARAQAQIVGHHRAARARARAGVPQRLQVQGGLRFGAAARRPAHRQQLRAAGRPVGGRAKLCECHQHVHRGQRRLRPARPLSCMGTLRSGGSTGAGPPRVARKVASPSNSF